jgi:hypothetical protein
MKSEKRVMIMDTLVQLKKKRCRQKSGVYKDVGWNMPGTLRPRDSKGSPCFRD